MAENFNALMSHGKRLTALGLGSCAVAVAFMSLGSATAAADVEEMAPTPQVTSRQALIIDDNSLRATAIGQARGLGESRSASSGTINAQGDVRDSTKAVAGTTASPFNLEANGKFVFDPPIGSW
ncbi:MAG: hypothetical protein WBB07_13455 [Mycobacterium sp.]